MALRVKGGAPMWGYSAGLQRVLREVRKHLRFDRILDDDAEATRYDGHESKPSH